MDVLSAFRALFEPLVGIAAKWSASNTSHLAAPHPSEPQLPKRSDRIVHYMGRRVSLFVTCVVDQLFPQVGMAMADVLERAGFQVDFPENQTCCGQPAFNSGYRAEARTVARHFLDTFAASEAVVVPSGSCTAISAPTTSSSRRAAPPS